VTSSDVQKVILACRRHPGEREDAFHGRLEELVGLCEAAGGEVVQTFVQTRPDVDPGLYLGSGKVAEIAAAVDEFEADVVVFDRELSPGQVRNLEGRIGCRVIDRTQLILDIFALRARSREGRLQVEIAQLQYLLPRLTGRGAELSRLGGGIGTRGPGETKLETDRRRIRQRIDHLRQELKLLQKTRSTQRARRAKSVPVVALVGYTNAGKSTLLSRWTLDRGSKVEERGHDRLFDTLDPLARRVRCGSGEEMVLLDTVGFVQDLPHLLVEAFRATLEEVRAADLIVHVVDASTPTETRLTTTYQVLSEIGALDKPVITFFNKMDMAAVEPPPDLRAVLSIYGSAATGANVAVLYDAVERQLGLDDVQLVVRGPAETVFSAEVAARSRVLDVQPVSDATVEATFAVSRRFAPQFIEHMNGDPRVEVGLKTGM
jgi:GTP-binding protein HflX